MLTTYNHYIRLDENNNIIKGFSDGFFEPEENDIIVNENTTERHFMLFGETNPSLTDINFIPLYKYEDGEITTRTEEERNADIVLEPYISNIVLTTDKEEILSNGEDTATITININGSGIDELKCYLTINGEAIDKMIFTGESIIKEFVAEENGLYNIAIHALDITQSIFIEAKESI